MAKIVSIFQFVGRAGSAVGSKGKGGKILLRQYQPYVANPQTNAQMAQRAKFKLAAQVSGMLGYVGRTALVANGYRKNERGVLNRMLQRNIVVNADGSQATLAYDLHLVDNPVYNDAVALQLSAISDAYTATFSGTDEDEVIAKSIMVHDTATGLWRHNSTMDTATTVSLPKSASEDAVEVFAYGIVLHPKTSEGYNNVGHTGANSAGYVIDLNKVTATNYAFSPSLSASLNIAGSGSQSGNGGSNQEPAVTANVTITANANDAQMGSVSGGGTYVQGAIVTLTATANEGYHFVSWSNGRTTASITVTADADATYTATFAADGQGGSGDNSGMDG